ncbi:hypothetical protein, partial [Lacticaseibacillus sp. 866-1]|uniref:hypothetical protein n=1 Tax=Lacticaseibacillus sp. 866-1 TaxID=2799576 RepID=UPI0019411EEE
VRTQGTNKATMNNKAAFTDIISAMAAVSYHDYEGKAERRPQIVFCAPSRQSSDISYHYN